ncbi:cysteine--tRNA ligase [Granulicella aggregans]|uniref:cysteine--tRNA ligase n=1 Tax=Granulicella aggregans TaxID=474949 RepID=UPI0037BE5A5B
MVEPLAPVGAPAFRMYACGPTVYDYGHIGNFRTFLHVDVLRRFLKQQGVPVQHVMNITDVDDKIIRNAAAAGKSIEDYSAKFERAFFEDMEWLGIEKPEHLPRATDSIPEMVALIQKLAEKDTAYQIEDGSWYFRIANFPEYGKLAKKDLEGLEDGARVDNDEHEKDAARDFALWKAVKPTSSGEAERHWETSLGPGRPGWHIECSAMATKYLGESFDLHAGGEDLMFPHHENEIAQSESATGHTFARHWMHVRFLLVEGRKMSKSDNNFFTLRDLLLKGYRASAIRFLLISVPYRHQLNFTFDGLIESTNAIDRLRTFHQRMLKGGFAAGLNPEIATATAKARAVYTASLANDLNTAEARAAIFDLVRAANSAADAGTLQSENVTEIISVLTLFDGVFAVLTDNDAAITREAIAWAEREDRMDEVAANLVETLAFSDADIDALVAERTQAKKSRNFARADAIRNDLLAKGILLEDGKDGVRWKRK